jgi:putative effector of murein hydrolase
MRRNGIKNRFTFEHKNELLLPRDLFVKRMVKHLLLGTITILFSLMIGIIGYHYFEDMGWIDSLLNASMILGGMGPVNSLYTDSGKIFASIYALFSGIIFLVTVGIIIAPAVHRFLHRLHIDEKDSK